MAKKVLIISTSLRGGSNSDILANECAKGAKEAEHDVELLSLKRTLYREGIQRRKIGHRRSEV